MIEVRKLVFNPFDENTYIVYDETKECVIIDPGCYEKEEQQQLVNFIDEKELNPVLLLNTHCHVDHMLGNAFVAKQYNLKLQIHQGDMPILTSADRHGMIFGLSVTPSPLPTNFLNDGDELHFGNSSLKVLFVPGHAPGHLAFANALKNMVIVGDVLFKGSIGRTDLQGGDHATLIESIQTKLLTLDDACMVYPGHGDITYIAFEKRHNPFLQ